MVNSRRAMSGECQEEIKVSVFKDIQIRSPRDVYLLAVWIALCDRARSTPTCQAHTTFHGLVSAAFSLSLESGASLCRAAQPETGPCMLFLFPSAGSGQAWLIALHSGKTEGCHR